MANVGAKSEEEVVIIIIIRDIYIALLHEVPQRFTRNYTISKSIMALIMGKQSKQSVIKQESFEMFLENCE